MWLYKLAPPRAGAVGVPGVGMGEVGGGGVGRLVGQGIHLAILKNRRLARARVPK